MNEQAPTDVRDTNDANAVNDRKWGIAIEEWLFGHPDEACALISDPSIPIPQFAREFLSDLAAGKVKRLRGAPSKRTAALERALVMEVFEACYRIKTEGGARPRDTPLDAAMASVAGRHDMEDTKLRGVYEKLRGLGFTRAFWSKYMRPRTPR